MKRFFPLAAAVAVIIAGAHALRKPQTTPLVPPAERQSLRDAVGGPTLDSQEALDQARQNTDGKKTIQGAFVQTEVSRRTYAFDQNTVQGHLDGSAKEIKAYPYEDGQSRLLFIAAEHRKEATLRLLTASFKAAPWDVVIIEREPDRPHPCEDKEKYSDNKPEPEPCKAMDLVLTRQNTRWEDGEYNPPELLDLIVARGKFNLFDYETFYLLRAMTSMVDQSDNRAKKEFCDKGVSFESAPGKPGIFASVSAGFMTEYGDSPLISQDWKKLLHSGGFLRLYAEKNQHPLATVESSKDTFFCDSSLFHEAWLAGPLMTQQVLDESTQVKDMHLGAKIADALNHSDHGRILVIYGGAHYSDLKEGLRKMFGLKEDPAPLPL